jgi:hypothetical protein
MGYRRRKRRKDLAKNDGGKKAQDAVDDPLLCL